MDLDNPENVQKNEGGEPSEKAPDATLKIKELEDKNKQLFERAKKAEEKVKEIKPLKEEPREEPKGINTLDPKIVVKLSKALADYNEDEIDFIYSLAKDNTPEAIIEATKNEWVKIAIIAKREKVAKEKQIPEPGNLPGAETTKKLTSEEISKDPDAHKRMWEKHMKEGGVSFRSGI